MLIIFMANRLLHPRLGFVLWLIGNKPSAVAVQLGFSTSGLRVHKCLLVKKRRELGKQYNLKLAVLGMPLPPTWFTDQGCFYQTTSYL